MINSTLRSVRGAILFSRVLPTTRSQWTAPAQSHCDWKHGGRGPDVAELEMSARMSLADHWLASGIERHGCVARFAMLSIDLLALGAPPGLIRGAQLAMGDKIEHARHCFNLASGYARKPLGPGPLNAAGVSSCPIFEDVVDRIVRDGCIAQTLGALEAEEARAGATDRAVADALDCMAKDGAAHSRWAWRVLRWAIERATIPQRATILFRLESALGDALDFVEARPTVAQEPALEAHGFLAQRTRFEVATRGVVEVIEPCARALLAQVDHTPAATPFLA